MEIVTELREQPGPSAVALGYFDGVHTAHAAVIRAMQEAAGEAVSTVLTFRLGKRVPDNKAGMRPILTPEQQLEQLERLGVERVLLPAFEEIAYILPEVFFRQVLAEQLHAQVIACGYDYSFGKGAAGTPKLLEQLCGEAGIALRVLPPMTQGGEPVSSTRIRRLLEAGALPEANALLGYCYYVLGPVVRGRSLGRTLGFPTLNQRLLPEQALPRFGVYNSWTEIEGRQYRSITNIGIKPTIEGAREPLAETYLLDAEGDFYGRIARVSLLSMTRPERKFRDLDELCSTVHGDIAHRRSLNDACPAHLQRL